MITQVKKIDPRTPQPEIIAEAAGIIRGGGLVAFPTETVYGLGTDAISPEGAGRVYAAKGRPQDNPLIVHIASTDDMPGLTRGDLSKAMILAERFWPGPLSVILKKSGRVPTETTGGLDTVALRMPSHPVALALIRESGCPIAAPSANRSGRPSPTRAEHVAEDLSGKIPLILDGGWTEIGLESTIVDLSGSIPEILRPGYVTAAEISDLIGEVKAAPLRADEGADKVPRAPGMKYTHYAPRADLKIVKGSPDRVKNYIRSVAAGEKDKGKKAGILCSDESKDSYRAWAARSVGSIADEDEIASRLYGLLREFDALGVDVIYSEEFFTPRIGEAIMNRLQKAAGFEVIEL